jgi:hypothetical protein
MVLMVLLMDGLGGGILWLLVIMGAWVYILVVSFVVSCCGEALRELGWVGCKLSASLLCLRWEEDSESFAPY